MTKISNEQKLKAVQQVLNEGLGQEACAKQLGVNKARVFEWCKLYRMHGEKGLCIENRAYTGQFKLDVIEYLYETNLSYYDVAAKFSIPSAATVRKWAKIYQEKGPLGLIDSGPGNPQNMKQNDNKRKLEDESKETLITEIQRLRMENDYLKKLNALVQERIAQENGKGSEQ